MEQASCITSGLWCSIKDDYRTLAELEDVNVVEKYSELDEEAVNE